MTTALSIITDAYRESNIIPMGVSPNTNQQTEALARLNSLVLSTIGNEVGDALDDLNIGGNYDQSSLTDEFIPDNARLVLNLSAADTLKLHPSPIEGQRVSVVDAKDNLATYNLTIDGNGRQIEGASSVVLNVNGETRQWMYRADLGEWVKISALLIGDALPFPQEFDDYFITMLAMRLNPRYGQALSNETMLAMRRARSQLRARYHAWRQIRSDLDTRGFHNDPQNWSSRPNEFKTGRPFSWR